MFNVKERIRLHCQLGFKGFAHAVTKSIDQNQRKPLKMKNVAKVMNEGEITAFNLKLDALAKLLDLHPYNEYEQLEDKLQPVERGDQAGTQRKQANQ